MNRESYVVSILKSGSDKPAGVGFVVDDQRIITCAHVVNSALYQEPRTQEAPAKDRRVSVVFPMLSGGESRLCKIAAWAPPPASGVFGGDVACLQIEGRMPNGVEPARLAISGSVSDVTATVFGYPGDPPRRSLGARVSVRLCGIVGSGALQLDSAASSAFRVQPGYSGSPVISDNDAGVLGMLVAASRDEGRDAYALLTADLIDALPGSLDDLIVPPCPYKGLKEFTIEDAKEGLFVGREDEIEQLREMVRKEPLVVVTGPSGVGKSSLVSAGLMQVLHEEEEGWIICPVSRPGGSPFDALAAPLLAIDQPGRTATRTDLANWVELLKKEGLEKLCSQLAILNKKPLIVCIDMFEQIFDPDICKPAVSSKFLDLILAIQTHQEDRLRLVCILRSDFLPQLLKHPDAGFHLHARLFTVSPMGGDRLTRVITEPAQARLVRYEDGLVEQIVRDAGDEGGLPLLEFALTRLWPLQRRRQLTLAEYHLVGGVSGALRDYAESVYGDLRGRFGEEQIRRLLLKLVRSRGGASEATRRVVAREQLDSDWPLAEELARRRLLVIGRDWPQGTDYAEIAHEALIRDWPRLAGWVDEDAAFQHWHSALEQHVRENELLYETHLAEADLWLAKRSGDVSPEVKELIKDSKSAWHQRIEELETERKRAEDAARQAEARRLAIAAELALASRAVSLQVAIALAIESARTAPGLEGDIAIRHAIRGAPVQVCRLDHAAEVRAVAFSPDGSRVATGSRDNSARVFDAVTGAELCRLDHDGAVVAVAYSPDGSQIATGSFDGSCRLFDAVTGAEVRRLEHGGVVVAVAFSPDGSQIATGSFLGTARVFDAGNGTEKCRLEHGGAVVAVAYSPDGTRVATGSGDGTARILDTATGAEVCRLDCGSWVSAVAFSPDSGRAAASSLDGTARVFDAHTGAEVCRLSHSGAVVAVAYSPDGTRVATGSGDGTARVFDAVTGVEVCRLDHGDDVTAVAFSPDGTRVATGSFDGTARVFNAATGAEVCHLDHEGDVETVVFSPDGTKVATGSFDGTARVFDAATGAEECHLHFEDAVYAVAFSPDGTRLATGDGDGTARVFDVVTGAEICRADFEDAVYAVAFSPDGSKVAAASGDSSARVVNAATGAEICRLDFEDAVYAVAFSPDGSKVAATSGDGTVRLFDPVTGDEECGLDHGSTAYTVAFSPDGDRVATGSGDGAARVLDIVAGAEICRLEHGGAVVSVSFSPDGTRLATGSRDGTARIWVIDGKQLIEQAEERLTRNLTLAEWHRNFGERPFQKTCAGL
jgi:WD40 repeat protein/energy-coupling factor transporter ATP-binding protein EcfA2